MIEIPHTPRCKDISAKDLFVDSITHSSPSLLCAMDDAGRILYTTEAIERLFGYEQDELIGKSVDILVPEKFREDFKATPLVRHGRRKDGSEFQALISLIPTPPVGGSYGLVTVMNFPAPDGKMSELLKANRFLNSIVENIPDMIFIKDAKELRFVRFNKAGEELLGYDRADLIGKNDYDFFEKAEADFFTLKDRNTLAENHVLDIPEEPIHTQHKGVRILHTKKIPISNDEGEPEYLLGISEDITEKKQMEETRRQLVQAQLAREEAQKSIQLRDEFISIASHELRTPLTSVILQCEVIPMTLRDLTFPGKERMITLFESSLRQLRQFGKLVDELLDVSRITAGRLVLKKEEVSLSDVISRTLESFTADLTAARCTVTTNLDPEIRGHWDSIRMGQIVSNLLENALKYGAGKPIEITTRLESEKAKLMVRDHGIGIAKEDQKKLFERFERVAPITGYRGLGLGLYITRQIVEAHGGTIRVESELGQGSTFTVELPLKNP